MVFLKGKKNRKLNIYDNVYNKGKFAKIISIKKMLQYHFNQLTL